MKSEEDKKLSNRYYSMMSRCYNKNNVKYKNYGNRGVTVCDRWKDNIKQYCKDVKLLPGYNKELLLKGKIQLDKDTLFLDNKVYSPETCTWITEKQNSQLKPSYMWWHYAWNINNNLVIKFYNIEHFCKLYKEKPKNVSTISHSEQVSRRKYNMGWLNGWFLFNQNNDNVARIFKATNINTGCTLYSYKCSKLAELVNEPVSKIYGANRPERNSLVDSWLIETKYLTLKDVLSIKNNRLAVIK